MLKFFFPSALQFGERPAVADASSCSSAAGGQPSSCLARLWGKQAELQSCVECPATRQRLKIQTSKNTKLILIAVLFFFFFLPLVHHLILSTGQKSVSSEAPPTTSHSDKSWLKRSVALKWEKLTWKICLIRQIHCALLNRAPSKLFQKCCRVSASRFSFSFFSCVLTTTWRHCYILR